MRGRGTVVVAAVSALVAAVVSVATTLIVVRIDDRDGLPRPVAGAGTASATGAGGLPELVSGVASGVVRIETTACTEGSVGSGFLISPELVATVAHVVAGAHKIVLTSGADGVPGTVVGFDAATELALVRADRPLSGHVFTLADRQPPIGSEVVGLGYPLGGGLSLVHGIVSAVDRTMTVSPQWPAVAASSGGSPSASPSTLSHLLQVDGLFTGGDSGGPLVAADGSVVGLVEARATQAQGIGFAVAATTARAAFERWRTRPAPVQVSGDCAAPVGPPEAIAQVSDVSGSPDGPDVQALFGRFATALNAGRYQEAFAMFSLEAQRRTTVKAWTARERSSRLFDLVVHQVVSIPDSGTPGTTASTGTPGTTGSGRSLRVEITFTSVQDAALGVNGQVCSLWHLTYLLVHAQEMWRIDRATPQVGSPQAC